MTYWVTYRTAMYAQVEGPFEDLSEARDYISRSEYGFVYAIREGEDASAALDAEKYGEDAIEYGEGSACTLPES